jgi:hypothetical protein
MNNGALHPGKVSNDILIMDFREYYLNRVDKSDYTNHPLKEGNLFEKD